MVLKMVDVICRFLVPMFINFPLLLPGSVRQKWKAALCAIQRRVALGCPCLAQDWREVSHRGSSVNTGLDFECTGAPMDSRKIMKNYYYMTLHESGCCMGETVVGYGSV